MAGLVSGRIEEICREIFEDPREEELEKLIRQLAYLEAERDSLDAEVTMS